MQHRLDSFQFFFKDVIVQSFRHLRRQAVNRQLIPAAVQRDGARRQGDGIGQRHFPHPGRQSGADGPHDRIRPFAPYGAEGFQVGLQDLPNQDAQVSDDPGRRQVQPLLPVQGPAARQTAAPKAAVSQLTFPFSTSQNKKNKSAIRLSLPVRTEFRKPPASPYSKEFYQISRAKTSEQARFCAPSAKAARSRRPVFLSRL